MTSIVIDRLNEEDFRRSIENRLRETQGKVAIERLKRLLAPYAGPGKLLPERFLTVESRDLVLAGWDALDESVRRHDRPEAPITALSIAFGWPGEEPRPRDAQGHLPPYVETRYFTDAAFPFSESTRTDLLEGYSSFGCSWGDDAEAVDTVLSVTGIDDLHAALTDLEESLLATDNPDEHGLRAGSLGACLLSALLIQAVTEQIEQHGLPRPLCVTAGSSGVYPYFDAPVAGMPEQARKQVQDWFDDAAGAVPVPPAVQPVSDDISQGAPAMRYSSLLVAGIPRAKKRAVLVLDESVDEAASRIASLRSNGTEPGEPVAIEPVAEAGADVPDTIQPDPLGTSPLLVKKPHPKALEAEEPPVMSVSAEPPDVDEPAVDEHDSQDWLTPLALHPVEPEREWSPLVKTPAEAPPEVYLAPEEPAEPAPPREPTLRKVLGGAAALASGLIALWRNRKGPPPAPRKRFPPR